MNLTYQDRPTLVSINSDDLFIIHLLSVLINMLEVVILLMRHAQVCVIDKVKNINLKVFNFMSRVNETTFLVQYGSRKCTLDEGVCNSKTKWNLDKCRRECKELDNWSSSKNDYL